MHILSAQHAHLNIMHLSNNVFCADIMLMIRFDLRTALREKLAGKGRKVVNLSSGFGDRGSVRALHARKPKGLGGLSE